MPQTAFQRACDPLFAAADDKCYLKLAAIVLNYFEN
jgi:hypothetical protein